MKKGFSLIELSAVILLIAVIGSGLITIVKEGFFYIEKSRQRTVAYFLAQEVMERYFDWNALAANGTYANPSPYPVTINQKNYNVTVQISNASVYPTRLKQIDVLVETTGERFALSSLKADY
ncbi:MAG: type II secretion system protein [Candidatus Omnitrophota bacterium]